MNESTKPKPGIGVSKMKASRKDVINVTNGLSKSILDKCIGKRVEEQFSDSTLPDSEVKEEKPMGDPDDSSLFRWTDDQNGEVSNPLGPPDLVVGEGEQKDAPMEDERGGQ